MRATNYWMRLIYNGAVIGIWPAAALAFIIARYAPYIVLFITVFIFSWAIFSLFTVWLYQAIIIPRRGQR